MNQLIGIYWIPTVIIFLLLIVIIILLKKKIPSEFLKNLSEGIKNVSIFIGKANSEMIDGKPSPSNMRMNVTTITWVMLACMASIHVYAIITKWDAGNMLILFGQDMLLVGSALGFKKWQKGDEDVKK